MYPSDLETKINLKNIQQFDASATEIITSASQVAFYVQSVDGQWEKTNLDGTFFIYERTAKPQYSIFITNRLRTNFVTQPITKKMDFQSASPFFLYRNDEMKKFGIWFSDTLKFNHAAEIINLIIQHEIPEDSFSAAKAALAKLPLRKAFDTSSFSSNSSLTDFQISPNLSIDAEIISIDFPEKDYTSETIVRPIARITPSKPVLWLPSMFESSNASIVQPPQQFLDKTDPLSQMQLIAAMSYLIKNDVEFCKKLYDAYLMSRESTSK